MIQLVSHQMKGHSCNQSSENMSFFFSFHGRTFLLCLKVDNNPAFTHSDQKDPDTSTSALWAYPQQHVHPKAAQSSSKEVGFGLNLLPLLQRH